MKVFLVFWVSVFVWLMLFGVFVWGATWMLNNGHGWWAFTMVALLLSACVAVVFSDDF